jgi:hypothetical protein
MYVLNDLAIEMHRAQELGRDPVVSGSPSRRERARRGPQRRWWRRHRAAAPVPPRRAVATPITRPSAES